MVHHGGLGVADTATDTLYAILRAVRSWRAREPQAISEVASHEVVEAAAALADVLGTNGRFEESTIQTAQAVATLLRRGAEAAADPERSSILAARAEAAGDLAFRLACGADLVEALRLAGGERDRNRAAPPSGRGRSLRRN